MLHNFRDANNCLRFDKKDRHFAQPNHSRRDRTYKSACEAASSVRAHHDEIRIKFLHVDGNTRGDIGRFLTVHMGRNRAFKSKIHAQHGGDMPEVRRCFTHILKMRFTVNPLWRIFLYRVEENNFRSKHAAKLRGPLEGTLGGIRSIERHHYFFKHAQPPKKVM